MGGVAGGDPWREMAEKNCVLRVTAGSQMRGVNLEGGSDQDQLGVCIDTFEASSGFTQFEQYLYRTAAERTGKADAKSEPGDLDLTIYSLRKFLRLAMDGNPSVIELLFVKDCLYKNANGQRIQSLAPLIISRAAAPRYMGYMESQRQRLLGERGQMRVTRTDLIEKYGFDVKYAAQVVTLGFQGVELLSTGQLTLPMRQEEADTIKAIKRGEISLQKCLQMMGDLERNVKDLKDTSPLQEKPDREAVEKEMFSMYWNWWKAQLANPLSCPY